MKISKLFTLLLALGLSSCSFNSIVDEDDEPKSKTLDESWTIMAYICGSNLESDTYIDENGETQYYGLATMDINEMLSVRSKPSNVNIVIQTGGATAWHPYYGISASKSEIYHASGARLIKDKDAGYNNMGDPKTLKEFIKYSVNKYKADHYGLILWNHGGAMGGVCFDDKYNDSLLNSEVYSALSGAFSDLNRTKKFDFIGYDACLMSVQDIADYNSYFFDYMVASEQTEDGYGWSYDKWLPTLYKGKPVRDIVDKICDSFIASIDEMNEYYEQYYPEEGPFTNDQTLAVLDLSKLPAYRQAFESFASTLSTTTMTANSFRNFMRGVKSFGYQYASSYGLYDAYDFLLKAEQNITISSISGIEEKITACKEAYEQVVCHFQKGTEADDSETVKCYGMGLIFKTSSNVGYVEEETDFNNWLAISDRFGRSGY